MQLSPPGIHMSEGQQYSLILHAVLLLVMIFGLPGFLHKKLDEEPLTISVDILPIAPISNVRPQEKVEPVKEKKPEAEKKTARKATVEARKEQEKPKEAPEPVPLKKEIAKKIEKKPEKKPEKKQKEDDLDSILKSVQETAKAEESKHPTEQVVKDPNKNKAVSQTYDSSKPLSMSEKDAIRQQFIRCWHMPAGAKDAGNLIVTLRIQTAQDGTVTSVDMAGDQGRYNSDTFFRAAADSAIRAVRKCSPIKNLPADKFGSWHDMELTFDPKDMI